MGVYIVGCVAGGYVRSRCVPGDCGHLDSLNYRSVYCHDPAMPKKMAKAKIACLDFSLQKAKMKMGVQVLVTDPEKLEDIRRRWVRPRLTAKPCTPNSHTLPLQGI